MKKLNVIATLALALIFAACGQAPEAPAALDMDALKAEIQAMEDAYAAAENAQDVDGIMVYYADNAVNMPNEEPIVEGKDAIRARLMESFKKANPEKRGTISFTAESIMADGDLLVEAGSSVYTSPNGEESTGKYISVFQKQGDKYVCVRDIWNEDSEDDDDDDDEDDMDEVEMSEAEDM